MLERLLTEQINPASRGIDAKSTEEMLAIIHAEDRKAVESLAPEIPNIARAVDAVAERLRKGGKLFYIGAGTSGRLGVLDASECPPTFNVPRETVQGIIAGGEPALTRATEATEDDPAAGANDAQSRGVSANDALIGVAASGRTPYVLGAIAWARSIGTLTLGISCTPASQLSQQVDIAIEPLPGPEILTGSTRMKAGTATKLALNMISTGVMIRLGYVYGNLMVNVQPTNAKLRDRAIRIVSEAAEVPVERAAELLQASGDHVRRAILMHKKGLTQAEAAALLERHNGRLADALNG